ncbi:uncharacterized protein AMSG_10163 [Thecamonas trahens ATCC 50062]|uniref:Transcription initiation factor TFIID subunit 8 n=1 Tax=Thecamonas trahens ATCC 50062 TaxID=461836 RepID=A0A0L0DQY9_THETB|nr:hypothetical protein AMSG_10163 [Thecamonas trahens ATCC 50062]KNC54431.1 hypothetical protein AMSG_10163 [Thecamonas trahens ATCC 50062]|eukprot:XP_013753724.1 hypothetical protein AMSG_10163 [Thecamonas trahens ATCC 50062]
MNGGGSSAGIGNSGSSSSSTGLGTNPSSVSHGHGGRVSASEFCFDMLKRAVAQLVANYEAFQGMDATAVNVFTSALARFMFVASKKSHEAAEHAGRTDANADDVVQAVLGMLGSSVRELRVYAAVAEAKPLPHVLLPIPAPRSDETASSSEAIAARAMGYSRSGSASGMPGGKHAGKAYIAAHLPPLPEPRTYIQTPAFPERVTDERMLRTMRSEHVAHAQAALTGLHARFPAASSAAVVSRRTPRSVKDVPAAAAPAGKAKGRAATAAAKKEAAVVAAAANPWFVVAAAPPPPSQAFADALTSHKRQHEPAPAPAAPPSNLAPPVDQPPAKRQKLLPETTVS